MTMKAQQRIVNIMSELVKNALEADASAIDVNIKRSGDLFEITIQDDGSGMDDKTLSEIKEKLNQPHQEIYDEYYSGLAGFNQSDSGLNVVGFQVDEAEIETSSEGTKIRVKRLNTPKDKH